MDSITCTHFSHSIETGLIGKAILPSNKAVIHEQLVIAHTHVYPSK